MDVLEHLGQGGFGVVEKVQDDGGNIFARKTFMINQPQPLDAMMAENVKKRFIQEAIRQEGIQHLNIIPVLSKNLSADPPYFCMPVAVSSLDKDLAKDHRLGGNFLHAILDIIAGLEILHSLRYYHRDLKPGNVLKFQDPQKGDFYAIGDFGLMAVRQTQLSTLTTTGMQMGADYYTAPEIIQNFKQASAQSDIYSLGCILHDCLVGTGKRVPCHEIRDDGPYGPVLKNCTRVDPARRFKSVTAVRDALLSLGDTHVKPKSAQTAEYIGLINDMALDGGVHLNSKKLEEIVTYIEDEEDPSEKSSIMRGLTLPAIRNILQIDNRLAARLGMEYASWIRDKGFAFEECDGLAKRLEEFVIGCDIEVQVECLLAMLYLGTSHNRWYVEEKFVKYTSRNMDDKLAHRMSIELRVEDDRFCSSIEHLKQSINFALENLHPVLYKTYREVRGCQ